ncbi:MAG: hypothetical protein K0R17_937 [Rariglobus sp.]|jgi:hypothetical protein|nr:hypothetical protein [Rariglobus sp.]
MKKAPLVLLAGISVALAVWRQLPPGDQVSPKAAGLPPGSRTVAIGTPPVAAVRHVGAIERVSASLDAYRSDPLSDLTTLQRALQDMDPAMFVEVFDLFIEKLPPHDIKTVDAYRLFFRAWGAVDGSTALTTAVTRLPKNPVRLEAGREAMQSWARRAPAATAQAVAALPDIYGKDYLVYALPHTYVVIDPLAAMAWAEALPADLRRNTLLHCTIKWLEVDPQATRAYATELAGTPNAVDNDNGVIFSRTAGTLARKDIADAARWVEQLPPESPARRHATLGLIDWWGLMDPEKAGAWLGRFPPSASLDPAIDRFARDLVHRDPTGAAAWAGAISDPVTREKCLKSVRRGAEL